MDQFTRDLMNRIADLERRLRIQESNENRPQINFLSTPIRLVGPPNTNYGAFPAMVSGTPQYFVVEGTWSDGVNTVTVPSSATGIFATLTIVTPAGASGYAAVFPANIAVPTFTSLTWQVATNNFGALILSKIGTVPAGHIPAGAAFDGKKGVGIVTNVNCSIVLDGLAYLT